MRKEKRRKLSVFKMKYSRSTCRVIRMDIMRNAKVMCSVFMREKTRNIRKFKVLKGLENVERIKKKLLNKVVSESIAEDWMVRSRPCTRWLDGAIRVQKRAGMNNRQFLAILLPAPRFSLLPSPAARLFLLSRILVKKFKLVFSIILRHLMFF